MKAFKGCVNRECKAYKKRIHFKDSYEYCPHCSQEIEYVCADCWKVLEQNNNRLCIACKAKQEQKRANQIDQIKQVGPAVVGAAGTAWKYKDKIVDAGKKAAEVAVKVVKK